MVKSIVVVGAGQAGAQAVETLRREGYTGRLVLVGDEPRLPYRRPPLSKKFLSGEMAEDQLWLRHQDFYDKQAVELRLGLRAVGLDRAEQLVTLNNGDRLRYNQLLLCLGATSRRLTVPGSELEGVQYLRSMSDVTSLRVRLEPGARVVIIGGGYIGLETAATARVLGCHVTVLETADRVMSRVIAPEVSAYFEDEHSRREVAIVCNTQVLRIEGKEGRVQRVICSDRACYEADLVLVGVGSVPNVQLASDALLQCDNGVVVDEYCRTSDPNIFAAGDCTNHPSLRYSTRVRLESVDNAVEQGKAAALNMQGRATSHDRIPWFWSDQYDNKLLVVGLSVGHDQRVMRGNPASRSFSVCYLQRGELIALEAVNNPKDYVLARKLVAARARPRVEALEDAATSLNSVV